jgi:hypothetical protein
MVGFVLTRKETNVAYCTINFKTKKQLKEAVAAGEVVQVYQPGPFGPSVPNGKVTLEGPHFPAPHTWYAQAVVQDGVVQKGSVK